MTVICYDVSTVWETTGFLFYQILEMHRVQELSKKILNENFMGIFSR